MQGPAPGQKQNIQKGPTKDPDEASNLRQTFLHVVYVYSKLNVSGDFSCWHPLIVKCSGM